jgi:tRNA-dihydrouridine synthase B
VGRLGADADEPLALAIVEAVVALRAARRAGDAEDAHRLVPERNALRLARAAEAAGVAMLTVHGRTREQGYKGQAEYDTIAAVKAALRIPVVANGDIDSPRPAVLAHRRRRADDRPRRPGPALDLPRDRPLPGHRRCPAPVAEAGAC